MRRLLLGLILLLPAPSLAQEEAPAPPPEPAMTLVRLDAIIMALDPEAQTDGHIWQMSIGDTMILIVTDARADRMRAMTPVRETVGITPDDMLRMMQANFDSALDARYAIAQGTLWSTFIHPLSALEKDEFISGLGQVVNLAQSYGTLYSGGALQYGGGDSGELQRKLIDDLLEKGEEI